MKIYAADEFLADLLSNDQVLTTLVQGAVYRHREGLRPQRHPHVLIRRSPEAESARNVSRGVFTCTAVVVPSKIEGDTRPPELIAQPIASAILNVLQKFEDDELDDDPTLSEVWGGQILVPDYSMSYGDASGGDVPATSTCVLELGVTIRVWAA